MSFEERFYDLIMSEMVYESRYKPAKTNPLALRSNNTDARKYDGKARPRTVTFKSKAMDDTV
jgi:hypothetical protein